MTMQLGGETAAPKIVTNRERLAGVVQAVGRRPADITSRWWESAGIFAFFAVVYSLIGYWLVVHMHVVGFETLDRFNRGLMIWHNDPRKLSAIGFDYPPLAVILVSPFSVVPGLARSMVVIPIASAIFGALTMMFLNTMMRRAQVLVPLRLLVLAGIGLNPLVVMYAATGARNFLWIAFVVAALGALFAWYVTADIRFVMVAGLAYSIAALTGYGSLVWFLVSLVMVAAILSRLGADGTEVEGTTVGFAAPTVYVIALWSVFNLILLVRPLAWLTDSSDTASSGGLKDFSLVEIAVSTGQLLIYAAPLAIVVLPALIFAGIARRNGFALWLGLLLAVSVLSPGLAVVLRLTDSPLVMSNALPILLVSVIGAIWLIRSAGGSNAMSLALAAGLALSIPWTFSAMKDFEHQGIERAFHDAVVTGTSQEGARTRNGSTVGYAKEKQMADYIRDHVDDDNAILTDNSQTYGVMFFTGDPALFFDRVDESDGPWRNAAKDPAGHVRYLLLSTDTSTDLLSQLYPEAASGDDTALDTVFANARYRLVEVPEGYDFGDGVPPEGTDETDLEPVDPTPTAESQDEGGVGGVSGEGSR